MYAKLSLVALLAFAGSVVPGSFDATSGLQLGNHHAQVRRAGAVPHLSVRQRKAAASPKTSHCAAKRAEALIKAPIVGDKPVQVDDKKDEDKPKDNNDDDKPKPKPQDNNDDDKPKPKPQDNNDDDNGGNGGGRWDQTYTGGDTTFYDPGLNACGTVDQNDAYIAAMPYAMWDSWPNWDGNSNHHPVCNRRVRVTYQGKSVDVKITDRCGGCNIRTSLDLSPDAFKHLAPLSAGRIHDMSWHFI